MQAQDKLNKNEKLAFDKCQMIMKFSIYLRTKDIVRSARQRDERDQMQRILEGHVNRWTNRAENQKKVMGIIFKDFDFNKLKDI